MISSCDWPTYHVLLLLNILCRKRSFFISRFFNIQSGFFIKTFLPLSYRVLPTGGLLSTCKNAPQLLFSLENEKCIFVTRLYNQIGMRKDLPALIPSSSSDIYLYFPPLKFTRARTLRASSTQKLIIVIHPWGGLYIIKRYLTIFLSHRCRPVALIFLSLGNNRRLFALLSTKGGNSLLGSFDTSVCLLAVVSTQWLRTTPKREVVAGPLIVCALANVG